MATRARSAGSLRWRRLSGARSDKATTERSAWRHRKGLLIQRVPVDEMYVFTCDTPRPPLRLLLFILFLQQSLHQGDDYRREGRIA